MSIKINTGDSPYIFSKDILEEICDSADSINDPENDDRDDDPIQFWRQSPHWHYTALFFLSASVVYGNSWFSYTLIAALQLVYLLYIYMNFKDYRNMRKAMPLQEFCSATKEQLHLVNQYCGLIFELTEQRDTWLHRLWLLAQIAALTSVLIWLEAHVTAFLYLLMMSAYFLRESYALACARLYKVNMRRLRNEAKASILSKACHTETNSRFIPSRQGMRNRRTLFHDNKHQSHSR